MMKALVFKEIRENLKLGALGLVVYAALLLAEYCQYVARPARLYQPLAGWDLPWTTLWFCGIFGAVLGWLQIFNERRPDLWAFLLHRPMTRTEIFLGKTLAGFVLYAAVVGLPLACFIIWALWPGHVAAPFELRMLRPLAVCILAGVPCYFAGMVVGVRQARWYGSRTLGLGLAFLVCVLMPLTPAWWQGLLALLAGAAILIAAAWGGFQSHGYYRGQPACGKAALTIAVMGGTLIVVVAGAALLGDLIPGKEPAAPWLRYVVTEDGAVFKVTQGPDDSAEIVDLEGKPLMDAKTGRMITPSDFNRRHAKNANINVGNDRWNMFRLWPQADLSVAVGWEATSDTLWYYWRRYGRVVGYDIATRRCIGSLGPNGFAQDLYGSGEGSGEWSPGVGRGMMRTATTVYRVDCEKRTVSPLFTTTSDDPILAANELRSNHDDWDYTAVVTKRHIHLLTPEGQPMWKAPYEPTDPSHCRADLYFLKSPGQFVLSIAPMYPDNERDEWKQPTRVMWLARDQGVVKSADLPGLPPRRREPGPAGTAVAAVAPPALATILHLVGESPWLPFSLRGLLVFSWASAGLVCLPIGLWLGRRYHFSFAAQAGWAVFHVLFGLPGLLAFLSVQEWPAREACPNCKRLRLVDRPQCEHCGADFAPPEKTGTEVFAPFEAST
jgi:hypothetical protein